MCVCVCVCVFIEVVSLNFEDCIATECFHE